MDVKEMGLYFAGDDLFPFLKTGVTSADLSVSSSSWGLGRAAVCDCGTPWTFLLPFFLLIMFK